MMNLLCRLNGRARVGAVFSADEETGGFTTLAMVKKGYAGKLAVVLDGNIDRLVVAQKGILSLRLVARGRACHASAPWRGENAVENLIAGYLKIKPLFKKPSETDSWKDTCAATMVSAGTVSNQVPDRAEMLLNIRFTDRTDPRRLLQKIKKRSGLRTELQLMSPFVAVPKNDARIRLFFRSMRQRLNPAMVLGRMNGATDARYFVRHTPSVVITGLKGGGAHSIHEWLDVRTVPRMEKALFDFITRDWPGRRNGR
jgi:acetylornithine deacetylase/succinyl-diaminopimelate desuccinylase-like protein